MNSICRTCLQKLGKSHKKTTFYYKYGKSISDVLLDCTSVKVQIDDGLPTNICDKCYKKTIAAYEFKMLALKSDETLNLSNRQQDVLQDNKLNTSVLHDDKELIQKDVNLNNNLLNSNCVLLNNQDSGVTVEEEDTSASPSVSPCKQNNEIIIENEVKCGKSDDKIKIDVCVDISDGNFRCVQEHEDCNLDVEADKTENITCLPANERNKRTIFCELCNRSFNYRYYVQQHVLMHNGQKQHKCTLCGKAYTFLYLLKQHELIHANQKPFSCEKCNKSFKYQSNLINHKRTHLEYKERKRFTCNICEKSFLNKAALIPHMASHKNEKSYTCEVCGKSFAYLRNLKQHMSSHQGGEKKFECPECGKYFLHKETLRKHQKTTHSTEKPYVCSYCGEGFKEKRILQVHTLRHTGDKPYSCKVCGKAIRHKAAIDQHMRVHSGETPFDCKLCPLKFKYRHHLGNHVKKVHVS